MRAETTLWTLGGAYFVGITILYVIVGGESAGIVLLGLAAFQGGLIAGWSWRWRRHHGERASDRTDGDAGDEAGSVGVYSTASLRPLGLAVGMSAVALGVPVGAWMTLAGIAIVASQVGLMVRDADS